MGLGLGVKFYHSLSAPTTLRPSPTTTLTLTLSLHPPRQGNKQPDRRTNRQTERNRIKIRLIESGNEEHQTIETLINEEAPTFFEIL